MSESISNVWLKKKNIIAIVTASYHYSDCQWPSIDTQMIPLVSFHPATGVQNGLLGCTLDIQRHLAVDSGGLLLTPDGIQHDLSTFYTHR